MSKGPRHGWLALPGIYHPTFSLVTGKTCGSECFQIFLALFTRSSTHRAGKSPKGCSSGSQGSQTELEQCPARIQNTGTQQLPPSHLSHFPTRWDGPDPSAYFPALYPLLSLAQRPGCTASPISIHLVPGVHVWTMPWRMGSHRNPEVLWKAAPWFLTPTPSRKQPRQVFCCTNVFHLSKRKT